MKLPHYYLALFGDPTLPNKDLVESGAYHLDPSASRFEVCLGDILLLYCSGSYKGHEMQVPGAGIVLAVAAAVIKYRYLPFARPIPKDALDHGFEEADLKKLRDIRFSSFWLFDISRMSFTRAVAVATATPQPARSVAANTASSRTLTKLVRPRRGASFD